VSGKKVVILGGGIAGMSAAHELIERGFQVEVLERRRIAGGKARSIDAVGPTRHFVPGVSASEQRGPPLPGEHGFRFFPGFYKHVVDTMARIPYGAGSVADNLVDASELRIASFDRAPFDLPARFPRTSGDLKVDVFAVVAALSGQVGVALDDGLFFATKMWQFLTSCHERRFVEYERINWWDFIEAGSRSAAYRKYFGNGITRSLVAAKAARASTKTIGDIFVQIAFDILLPDVAADRLLNGPTNDVWIDPWLAHLRRQGVTYHMNADIRSVHCEGGRVTRAVVFVDGRRQEITGDYFIGALPVERMVELIEPELVANDPSLANLHELTRCVEWMNGIQYFLKEDVPIAHGHVIYIDSPWALTSVSQAQFWRDFDLSRRGDGAVKGILSVDISDFSVQGLNGKPAQGCTPHELANETWAQLKRSLNVAGEVLRDEHLHSWFIDPDLEEREPGDARLPRYTNTEPLLVNYVDTWRLRPEAVTRIPNFFLASDYVRTHTDLATMEAANEAARRAVNGVLWAARSEAERCAVWDLHEPEAFAPFRAYDRVRYRRGLPWDGEAMAFARSVVNLSRSAGAFADLAHPDNPVQLLQRSVREIVGSAPELVALRAEPHSTGRDAAAGPEAGAVAAGGGGEPGLRRLRILRPSP
jgi:uncharacterized protein with NAD-binding domain and iron-sulfur cluster